ncbi:MAG: substrate-binding domain-containing protein, partial [Erysipelotrichaceae bacterium]|nr:substrate-binding domain-containing protein [Erysipelotrichaceae bacterium]
RRSDAVIVYTKTIDDKLLDQHASKDFPIFVLGHIAETQNPYVQSFLSQDTAMPLDTCEYLIRKGHRRIGFATGFAESYGTIRSMNGYRLSMKNHGLKIDESLIFDAKGSQVEDGYRVTEEKILARIDDMDGIIFSNDDIAVGAMKCFNDHNIAIPERLSVIGKHNIPLSSSTNPPLTTSTVVSNNDSFYSDLIRYLDSCIKGKEDKKIRKILDSYRSESVIIERETVKDLNQ